MAAETRDGGMTTASMFIPGCDERGTQSRPTPAIFDAIDVADYLRLRGDRKSAVRRVKHLRSLGLILGFRAGKNVVYTFDEVCQCAKKMQGNRPA